MASLKIQGNSTALQVEMSKLKDQLDVLISMIHKTDEQKLAILKIKDQFNELESSVSKTTEKLDILDKTVKNLNGQIDDLVKIAGGTQRLKNLALEIGFVLDQQK